VRFHACKNGVVVGALGRGYVFLVICGNLLQFFAFYAYPASAGCYEKYVTALSHGVGKGVQPGVIMAALPVAPGLQTAACQCA
jgi:hypothetical protein